MKKFQRDYWLEAHAKGRIQMLVNVGILTRGYNDTEIIDCIFARPTNSLPLYLQSVGRLARIDNSGKKFSDYLIMPEILKDLVCGQNLGYIHQIRK